MAYAAGTTVSTDRSKSEIERVLARYGARSFGYATQDDKAMVQFRMLNEAGNILAIKMIIKMPNPKSDDFTKTPAGRARSTEPARQAYEQACRARWRAMLLIIKAKLEAVQIGITTLEREFMADILLPGGKTIGEMVAAQRPALESGGKLKLLE